MKLRTGKPEEVGMSSERLARISEKAKRWVTEEKINPALAVLVARRGVIVLEEAFGNLTPAVDSPPLTPDSLFLLMSCHKPFVATLAMILVERGELGLNRPVQYYLPEFTGQGKEKSLVWQLLTHTSGMDDDELNAMAEKRKGKVAIPPLPADQYAAIHENLCLRYDLPLSYEPGSEQRYSMHGYALMIEIIRRISGQSYPDFAREQLFEPLGMASTHYILPEALRARAVIRPSDAVSADMLNNWERQDTFDGWAFSSVQDIAVFAQMFLNGGVYGDARILSPISVAEMTRNQIPGVSAGGLINEEHFPEAGWGLGWCLHVNKHTAVFAETLPSAKSYNHMGWGGTLYWVDPVQELVGCYFSVEMHWENRMEWLHNTRGDLFVNGVTAAIIE
jgi:CubicO group peptidase (beta-lactamase class C family)